MLQVDIRHNETLHIFLCLFQPMTYFPSLGSVVLDITNNTTNGEPFCEHLLNKIM